MTITPDTTRKDGNMNETAPFQHPSEDWLGVLAAALSRWSST